MLHRPNFVQGSLAIAVATSLLTLPNASFAQEDQIEEVLVTGSYIRRTEGFTQASQVTQITAEDLEAEGTLNMAEVVQNLSFVNGSSSAITNTIQGTDSRSSNIDLRGLGARSTLTLLDGKRLVNENVNALIPTIALQRIDIVADGAAALYGNEAVAGVVNFVPYTSYDGFRMETYAEGDSRGDFDEHSVQVLWGGDIGDLDVVVAAQMRAATRLGWDERPLLAQSGLSQSSNAPGRWTVPPRGPDGEYTGGRYSERPDPNCGQVREGYEANKVSSPYGFLTNNGVRCRFDYGDTRSYRDPFENTSYFGNATWDYSDDLTLSLQGFWARLAERSFNSTASSGGQEKIALLDPIRGELPGNPFRAINSAGQPLYAVDFNADGVPDRDPNKDLNGDGMPDAILTGNGGLDPWVPLYEDVIPRTMRPINKTMGLPGAGVRQNYLSADSDNLRDNLDHIGRYTLQADFSVPFIEGWEGLAAYTYNYRHYEYTNTAVYNFEAIQQGLNCDVVNDRNSCYNPFFVVDPANATPPHVFDAVYAVGTEKIKDTLDTLDIVLNGEVPLAGFELPGGPIGAAVGFQRRNDEFTNTPHYVLQAGTPWIGAFNPERETTGSREIDAWFAEFAVPVLENLEVELAVRREEFSTGQVSTDPKYGITYSPVDWLVLRATQGDAFIAPSLEQLYNPVTCGLRSITDRFTTFDAFGTTCAGGNPNLSNETSESSQLGFDLVFDDFDLHVTWNETDFQNRIFFLAPQQIVDVDFINFKAWSGFTGSGEGSEKPTEDQVRSWISSGLADPRIQRDPNDVASIRRVDSGSSNAETVKVTAWDIQGNYSFSFDNIGQFRLNLQATYIDEFLFQANATEPVRDGAGKQNYGTGTAPALPKLKANLRLGWVNGDHSVVSTVHYVDDLTYDGPVFTFMNTWANTYHPDGIRDTGIYAWTDMDIAYTYRGLEMFDGEMALSVGSRNVFDREAQRSPLFAGAIGELQDPLGRMLYARVVYDF